MTSHSFLVIPPFRYAIVEKNVYRGAYPRSCNYGFLRRLQLQSIVSLVPKPPHELMAWCETQRIAHHFVAVPKFKEGEKAIDDGQAQRLLELLLDAANQPIFIHCLDGVHHTGMIVMILRKLQGWHLSAALSEFARFVRGGAIDAAEAQFVERFRGSAGGIALPARLPPWLWGGVQHRKHASLRLRLHPDVLAAAACQEAAKRTALVRTLEATDDAVNVAVDKYEDEDDDTEDDVDDDDVDNAREMELLRSSGAAREEANELPIDHTELSDADALLNVMLKFNDGETPASVTVSRSFVALDLSLSNSASLQKVKKSVTSKNSELARAELRD